MTGKDMLQGIQNLDAELIEESEFGTFGKGKARGFGKKKLLLILAAALIMATMTAAAAITRWTATMQYGDNGGTTQQISEQVKKQAEQSGLSATPTETKDGKKKAVSATDNGITVTLAQTLMDQYGGRAIFRIEGLQLEEGQAPWAWWDYRVDGEVMPMSWGAHFFDGVLWDADHNPTYAKNGQPVPRVGEDQQLLLDYQLADGSIEFSIDFAFSPDESMFGKEMAVTFTGFGIQGEKFEDEDIMTTPGNWVLRWTLEGTTEAPKKWTPNAKVGDLWDVTLVEAEIGQYSMKFAFRLGDEYTDNFDFTEKTGWSPTPASIRLKDGTDIRPYGNGGGSWDADSHTYTCIKHTLNIVLDPEQIAGVSFYNGSELNDQGKRVSKPYYYVPFE